MVPPVTATLNQSSPQQEKRPPLLPSDSGNVLPRRPKLREVSSRYLTTSTSSSKSNSSSSSNTTSSSNTSASWSSSISSRRSQSPVVSGRVFTTPKSSVRERAVSAERRRPGVATTPSNEERMLLTSKRSLSVSFQGESFVLPGSKVKPPPTSVGIPENVWKGTPERRKTGVTPVRDRKGRDADTQKPSDQQKHRWPARLRNENSGFMTRSLNYGFEDRLRGSREQFRKSTPYQNDNNSVGIQIKVVRESMKTGEIAELDSPVRFIDRLESDGESVSSPQSSESGNAIQSRGGLRGLIVPTKSWQKANIRRHDSIVSARYLASLSRSSISSSSPRQKEKVGPTRTMSGVDISTSNNSPCSTPSTFGFAADCSRKKFWDNWISDAHELRLLYNRHLQWRLANSRLENVMLVQKHTAERSLYNAWRIISNLRSRTTLKRIELQLLSHNLKLYSIMKEQEPHLEDWNLLDRDNLNSLSGAIVALEANIVCLPAGGGATVDVQKVREALSSALNMMQSMDTSVRCLLAKAENMNLLVANVSNLTARERGLLGEYKELLSTTFIPLQMSLCSLRTHALQVQCVQKRQA